MMSKHTPGPWEIRRPAHITWNGPTGAFEIYAGDKLICQRPWAEGNPQAIKEHEANASLIAAAPDLLDACEEAIALIEGWDSGATEADVRRVMGLLNTAIAKARSEGRSG